MKFLLFLLLPLASYCQPTIKSSTIKVDSVTFLDACNKLLDLGYQIEKKDNDLQTASTEYRQFANSYNAEYKIIIRVKDSVLTVTGVLRAPSGTGALFNDEKIYLAKAKKSPVSIAFGYLDAFAKSFNKPVEYLNQ